MKLQNDLLPCLPFLLAPLAYAQEEPGKIQVPDKDIYAKYFDMTPEELLSLPTALTEGTDNSWLGTPAAAHVLTQADLMNSGHTQLAEQLRMVPGMMVSNSAGSSWAVSTRSFQHRFASMQLVLQDGREIYTPTFGGVFWGSADLPLEILDSIEVIRGPGATLWGSNAVNGIINIQTLEAADAQENILTVGGGNEDYRHAGFRQGGELFGGHYYTWGKWSRRGNPHYATEDSECNQEMGKFGFRADLPGFGEDGWTLHAEVFDQKSRQRFTGPIVLDGLPPTGLPEPKGTNYARGYSVHGKWGGTFDNGIDWKFHSYFSEDDRDWDAVDLEFGVETFEADFQIGKSFGIHNLLAGIRHRHHDFNSVSGEPPASWIAALGTAAMPLLAFTENETTEEINSFFFQDTVDLRDNLHLLVGTKFEDNYTGGHWVPSARVWWEKDASTTYWASYSNAQQLPGYDLRYATATTVYQPVGPGAFIPIQVLPNQNSMPAELEQWEAGWRQLASDNLSLDFAVFYGQFEDLTLIGNHRANNNLHNTDSADTYGGEIAANWHPSANLQVRTSVSYSDTDFEGLGATTDEYSVANWRANLVATYTASDSLRCNLGLYATERASEQVPGYLRTDAGITWTPVPEWEVSLQGQNLSDSSHPEDYSAFNGTHAYEVPRTAYLQIRRWF